METVGSSLNFHILEHDKIYCYSCFKEGIVNELPIHCSKTFCIPCPKHNGRSKFRIEFFNGEFKVFRGIVFGNRPQSEVNKDVYQHQKENNTGWCSNEAIMKKNSYEHNSLRQKNAAKRGNKRKSVETQMDRGLHPTQTKLKNKMLLSLKEREVDTDDLSYFEIVKLFIKEFPLKIDGRIVENASEYNKKCGSIGLTGISNDDRKRHSLNAGKSIDLGMEIKKFWRILSRPTLQDINYDYGRWFNISNNYTDFEIIILCVDVPEQDALLTEAAWAIRNNAHFKYNTDENGSKVQIKGTHGYWM